MSNLQNHVFHGEFQSVVEGAEMVPNTILENKHAVIL